MQNYSTIIFVLERTFPAIAAYFRKYDDAHIHHQSGVFFIPPTNSLHRTSTPRLNQEEKEGRLIGILLMPPCVCATKTRTRSPDNYFKRERWTLRSATRLAHFPPKAPDWRPLHPRKIQREVRKCLCGNIVYVVWIVVGA